MTSADRIAAEMFFVDRRDGRTLQMQLATSIIATILDTRARPGTRMPSSRKLAEYLGISRLTVTLVYQELVARGYLDALPRSGFVVSERAPQRRIDLPQRLVPARDVNWGDWLPRRLDNRRQILKPQD